jgi:PDDEXK-like domain of unknown function (DUF3799)
MSNTGICTARGNGRSEAVSAHRTMIDKTGLYQMSAADYHVDPCLAPSLSSSVARELVATSPLHAWHAHSRLNPDYLSEEKEAFDIGTAAHAVMLEGFAGVAIIDAKDWRTNAARIQREEARAAGKIPLLAHRWDDVQAMVGAARIQLALHEGKPQPFTGGKPEQTLIWREDGVWLRARLDWLHDGGGCIDDLKTTDGTANPEAWTRSLFGLGYDIQAAFYLRGLKAVTGQDATFRFVVQETYRPFALSVIDLTPAALELAGEKVAYAIRVWRECLSTGKFPGYPTRTCSAEVPGYEAARWLERQYREERPGVVDDGRDVGDLLNRE